MPATVTNAEAVRPTSSATGVSWDLNDLYRGVDDARIEGDLEQALGRARSFVTRSLIPTPPAGKTGRGFVALFT